MMKPQLLAAAGIAAVLLTSAPASALTFILDFDSAVKTDIFSDVTNAFNPTPYGFAGLNATQVQTGVLDVVTNHYRDYPTVGADAMSPLPVGMELDLDFEIGTVGLGPSNGDTDFYYIGIGTAAAAGQPFGRACLGCVRDSAGAGPTLVAIGDVVGSVFTDSLVVHAGLANDDAELLNLIANTTSHEIGHTLSLPHSGAQDANPGASQWGLLGSGATLMPDVSRVLDREFTYAKFGQLIGAVGLRDVTAVTAVPEPATHVLFGFSVAAFGLMRARSRRRKAS